MGRTGKLVIILILIAAVIVGWTMLQPQIVAYQVKTAARIACNQAMREVRYGTFNVGGKTAYARDFISKVGATAQVSLKPEDFEFTVDGKPGQMGDFYCSAKIKFPTKTPWLLLSDFTDIGPYKKTMVVRIDRQKAAGSF